VNIAAEPTITTSSGQLNVGSASQNGIVQAYSTADGTAHVQVKGDGLYHGGEIDVCNSMGNQSIFIQGDTGTGYGGISLPGQSIVTLGSQGVNIIGDTGSGYGSVAVNGPVTASAFTGGTLSVDSAAITSNGSGVLTASGLVVNGITGTSANSFDGGAIVSDGSGKWTTQSVYTGNIFSGGMIVCSGLSGMLFGNNGAFNGEILSDSQITTNGSGSLSAVTLIADNGLGVTGGSSLDGGAITTDGSGNMNFNGQVFMNSMGSSDPHVVGQLWSNAGVLTISAG
jgi:hypothetical protein